MNQNELLMNVLEIFKYIIPSLIIYGVIHVLLKNFFDSESEKRKVELKVENNRITLPVKLQAYERMVVLLERMSPDALIFRVSSPGVSATQLKIALIQDINNEYQHNVSQQVYISPQAWQMVRIAKEEMVNIINTAYSSLGPNSVGLDLSKAIFETMIKMDNIPTNKALEFLRKEFHLLFD